MPAITAYIGTYTGGESRGIYRIRIDDDKAHMSIIDAVDGENPSYLALSHRGDTLYATAELGEWMGLPGGGITAWRIAPDGSLSPLAQAPTGGGAPCHLATDAGDDFLFCANYAEGTATVFPLGLQGVPGGPPRYIRHQGSGPNAARQEMAHVHFTLPTPDGKYLAVVDLGIDKVMLYPLDDRQGFRDEPRSLICPPGSGPRHLDFSPDGRFAYVVCELSSTVLACAYGEGEMEILQQVSTLPGDFRGQSTCAALRLSPGGRFVCASNRGHDSLAVFRRREDGTLGAPRTYPTLGRTPRDFAYLPDGRHLLAANQDSSSLILFAVDEETGALTDTGASLSLPNPVCILWAPEG